MKLAFDLYEAAEEIMRQNLRRTFPDAAREEIERRLAHWLQKRPGNGGANQRYSATTGTNRPDRATLIGVTGAP